MIVRPGDYIEKDLWNVQSDLIILNEFQALESGLPQSVPIAISRSPILSLAGLLNPPLMFFALGLGARLIRSDLEFPPAFGKALAIYLLVGIGLHGGAELARADLHTALAAVMAALAFGVALPLLAYATLRRLLALDRFNAAGVAAHYGSVSAATFVTAVAYLESRQIPFESYPLIMLAVMESPAIVVALLLAQRARKLRVGAGVPASDGAATGRLLREALTNGSVVLLCGTMLIGAVLSARGHAQVKPLFETIFMGALCLFILEMGLEAGARMGELRRVGPRLVLFGLTAPLVGAMLGAIVGGTILGFGVGGTTLVMVLAGSASYIAVPPAVRHAIPEANPSYSLTLALGITFPFNVALGIPMYHRVAEWLAH